MIPTDAYAPKEIISAASFESLRTTILKIYDIGYGDRGYGQGQGGDAQLAVNHPYKNWPHIPPDKYPGNLITAFEWQQLQAAMAICLLHQNSDLTKLPGSDAFAQGKLVASEVSYDPFASGDIPYSMKEMDTNRMIAALTSMTLFGPALTINRLDPWSNALKLTLKVEFVSGDDARYFFNSGGELRFLFSRTGETNIAQDAFWTAFLTQVGMVGFGAYTTKTVNQASNCHNSSNIGYYNLTRTPQQVFTISGDCIKLGPWPQINHKEGDSVTKYDITSSPAMNSNTEQAPTVSIQGTPATAEIGGNSCNKFIPTVCSMPPGPKKATPVKWPVGGASAHHVVTPAPFVNHTVPPYTTQAPDTLPPVAQPESQAEMAARAAALKYIALANEGIAASNAKLKFQYVIAEDEANSYNTYQYAFDQWKLDHNWTLTPESIDEYSSTEQKQIPKAKDDFQKEKPPIFRTPSKPNVSEIKTPIDLKTNIQVESISYLNSNEYIAFPIKPITAQKSMDPKINVEKSFEYTFNAKKDFQKDIYSVFSLGNLNVILNDSIDLIYHSNNKENFQLCDERNTISLEFLSLDKMNIEKPSILNHFHSENDKLVNDFSDYVDFLFSNTTEYFVRDYHNIPNPNMYIMSDTKTGKIDDSEMKQIFGDVDPGSHEREIEPIQTEESCCNNSKNIVGTNFLKTYDGEMKLMVTIPACSDSNGDLSISVDLIKNNTNINVKDTMHFYIPIFLPKGINISLLSSIGDLVNDFVQILKMNNYHDSKITLITWSHDFQIIYTGKVADSELEYKINSLSPSKESITNANAVYKYIVSESKIDLQTSKYVFWFCAGNSLPPTAPSSTNISNFIFNLYNKLNSVEWAGVGQILNIETNNDLWKKSQDLSILNQIDGGELQTVEYWIDGFYLNEIKTMNQPLTKLSLYGLNNCVQQTLYVKITTTTNMNLDVHLPINSPTYASVQSHAKKTNQLVNLTRFIDNDGETYYAYEMNTSKRKNKTNMDINTLAPFTQQILKK